jgi:hypothetical protein
MANRGGEDYLDKALDQAEKFAGKKVPTLHTPHLHIYYYCAVHACLRRMYQTIDH